jgi:hypothetical protein
MNILLTRPVWRPAICARVLLIFALLLLLGVQLPDCFLRCLDRLSLLRGIWVLRKPFSETSGVYTSAAIRLAHGGVKLEIRRQSEEEEERRRLKYRISRATSQSGWTQQAWEEINVD